MCIRDRPLDPQGEHVRQVVVPGEQVGQHRQAAERGVGGQGQQDHGGELHDVEQRAVPQRGPGHLGEDGHPVDRPDRELLDQQGDADQHDPQQRAQHHLCALRPAHPRLLERRNGVRDGLDPGQRGASVGEGPQQEQRPDGLEALRLGDVLDGRGRLAPDQPGDDDQAEGGDVDDRGPDEGPGARADAPQVDQGDQQDHGQAQPGRVRQELGEGGGQRGDPGGHRDGHVEDVVDDQAGARHQARPASEVGLGDAVRAAALGEAGDHLPVREGEDGEQGRDRQRDRERVADPARAREGENQHDRLGPVRHRRQGIERQRRQAADHAETVLFPGRDRGSPGGDGPGDRHRHRSP